MPFCERCHEHVFVGEVCACRAFRVWNEEEGESEACVRDLFARSASAAVEKWADEEDAYDEPRIAEERDTPTVKVRQVGSDVVMTFKVSGYFQRVYNAEKVEG